MFILNVSVFLVLLGEAGARGGAVGERQVRGVPGGRLGHSVRAVWARVRVPGLLGVAGGLPQVPTGGLGEEARVPGQLSMLEHADITMLILL